MSEIRRHIRRKHKWKNTSIPRSDQGDLRETQTQTTQLRFPAQYVEMVIARNLNKHKLMKHEEMTTDITRHIEAKRDL